ncbi:uncharacterized protein Dana_GF14324, isoform C [Drosophila ananassae]|uniref:Uncharacterized protein, isoform C n=1 Tax=Drosophila ananassae TaxID=7217 RepID=A0A0P8XG90_DROAN|nr:uncharacterized protein Dana_GF14324, isoform C [Drosophila ananassae]
MDATFHQTMESLDLPKEYWDLKLEPQSPSSAVVSELFSLTETDHSMWLYDDNFANGITLIGDEETMTLNDAASLEMLSDEEFVVEIFDLKDEECLLDQKAPHNYVNYEANSYQPNIDVVSQPIIPETKVQFASGTASAVPVDPVDFNCDAPSLILQQLTPPQSPPQFDAIKQQAEPHSVLVKAEEKVHIMHLILQLRRRLLRPQPSTSTRGWAEAKLPGRTRSSMILSTCGLRSWSSPPTGSRTTANHRHRPRWAAAAPAE